MAYWSRETELEIYKKLPETEVIRLMQGAAELGVGIEINSCSMMYTPEEADTVLKMYRIAKECGLTPNEVYEALKGLTYQRILDYIPQKNSAYITYLQRRVEGRHLYFSPMVYKERKKNYEERIQAMVDYVEEEECRSVQLLRYFGEHVTSVCGHCDVCIDQRRKPVNTKDVKAEILKILADGVPHAIRDFDVLSPRFTQLMRRSAWEQLTAEGMVGMKDGEVYLIQTTHEN
jgi:ATP-dependent DNA helicase RecQ